ncbi:MAG: ribonuclease H-like YkuK family protein [Candidatus Doudnabacteria bacterium]|nr:ribonuclease H-like YkuK family protein [Candidatus Doudnabacteria bacterium]
MLNTEPIQFNQFNSPSYGDLNFDQVLDRLLSYVGNHQPVEYELIIGTDSMPGSNFEAEFVSAIVVHRKHSGGIYFWSKSHQTNLHSLRDRIFQEALHSLKLAEQLIERLKQKNIADFGLTIHVDVGPNGETKKMLQEIVGMIKGNGFSVKTKPESYGASSVADRHT